MLAFFLHPKYRDKNFYIIFIIILIKFINLILIYFLAICFQQKVFKDLSKIVLLIWKKLGGRKNSSNYLLTKLGLYWNKDDPFNNPYIENLSTPTNWWLSVELKKGEDHIRILALKLHAIIPHNATCKCVFSILGWYLRKWRTK